MKSVKLKDAQSHFMTLLNEAIRGETIEITEGGKTVASLVPAQAEEKKDVETSDFGRFLLSFPGGLDLDRDVSGLRDVEF